MPFRLPQLAWARRSTPSPSAAPARQTLHLLFEDGSGIDVLRVRDARARRLKLSVDERGARLTLPLRASERAGERFLAEHRDWLHAQWTRLAEIQARPLQRDVTTALPLRGQAWPLQWHAGRFTAVTWGEEQIHFAVTARAGAPAIARALRDFYEAQARADIGRWLPRYLSDLPRAPRSLRLKPMRSQWGSLTPDGVLTLDLALVLGAPAAFEYVLVHELCHLIHHDHSPRFWHEVEARCPDWRTHRDYFKHEGRRLKAQLSALTG